MARNRKVSNEIASIADLTPDPQNARKHNPRNVGVIVDSLHEVGAARSIVIDEDNVILAGNATIEAAAEAGIEKLRVVDASGDEIIAVRRSGLTAQQKKRLALFDNRAADLAEWNAEVFDQFTADDIAGMFTADEVNAIISAGEEPATVTEDDFDAEAAAAAITEPTTKPGDLWLLGRHRLLCGDCRSFGDVQRLFGDVKANVAITSPPYASQRKYDESSGFKPIPPDEYVEWFSDVQANIRAILAADGSYFLNIKEHCDDGQRSLYVKDLTIAHVRAWGWRFVDELCWYKKSMPGGWPNRFRNDWEPVFHFTQAGEIKFRPSAVLRESEQVFQYEKGRGSFSKSTGNLGYGSKCPVRTPGMARPGNVLEISIRKVPNGVQHEAAFPPDLPEFFIRAFSDDDDIVFDPFMGSGSTLIAAHRNGRLGYGTEISPKYCDVIIARWEKLTGEKATLDQGTGH